MEDASKNLDRFSGDNQRFPKLKPVMIHRAKQITSVNNMIVDDLSERKYEEAPPAATFGIFCDQRMKNHKKGIANATKLRVTILEEKVDLNPSFLKVKYDSVKCSLDDFPDETRAPIVSKSVGNNLSLIHI